MQQEDQILSFLACVKDLTINGNWPSDEIAFIASVALNKPIDIKT